MSIFDLSLKSDTLLEKYLSHLGMKREEPTLNYLNRLIKSHQTRVPFENMTRIYDYKNHPEKFSTITLFVERLESGGGGVCWSLARGFGWLLTSLKFKTEYLYMEPGHVSLKVTLDQDYYVDVGYAAPFFEAKPLYDSFTVESPSEVFNYAVEGDSVLVTRTPGPVKRLILKPYSHQQIADEFNKLNVWGQNKFLADDGIIKFIDGGLVKLWGENFTDYRNGKIQKQVSKEEFQKLLVSIFNYQLKQDKL